MCSHFRAVSSASFRKTTDKNGGAEIVRVIVLAMLLSLKVAYIRFAIISACQRILLCSKEKVSCITN